MARRIEFKKFLIIEAETSEMVDNCGSMGICDCCGKPHLGTGYYIAVLNQWYCPKCFEEWKAGAKYYPEDAEVEIWNFRYYGKLLGLIV